MNIINLHEDIGNFLKIIISNTFPFGTFCRFQNHPLEITVPLPDAGVHNADEKYSTQGTQTDCRYTQHAISPC